VTAGDVKRNTKNITKVQRQMLNQQNLRIIKKYIDTKRREPPICEHHFDSFIWPRTKNSIS
jgi:hypothetical protein